MWYHCSYIVAFTQAQNWVLRHGYSVATLWRMKTKRKQARRTGRPKKALKTEVVRFRVTAEQKRAFMDAAAKDGLEVSAWLRRLGLRSAGVLPGRDE